MVVTPEELDSIREGLYRVTQASRWEWRAGSTPFFWRWTDEFQDQIQDGIKLWISGRLTPFKRAQKDTETLCLRWFSIFPQMSVTWRDES
jgi:hypothetical protein